MADAVVGSVAVDVVPSVETFWRDFEAKTRPGAAKAGSSLGDAMGGPLSDKIADSVSEGLGKAAPASKEQGSRQGAAFGDSFDKEVTTRLDAALKNLPNAEIGADTTEAQASIQQLRAQIDQVNKSIGVNITDDAALVKIEEIRAGLESLSRESPDIRVKVDAGAASLELAGLQAQINKLSRSSSPGGSGEDLAGLGKGAASASLSVGQLLVPALGAAAAVIAPLTAVGTAGLGTLLLGAKGLKDEVTTGLTPAFTDLESAASAALGPGVTTTVDQLKLALPQLTPLVKTFGGAIGDEAAKLATYLNNGGLQSFTTYAEHELPIVEHAFESVTTAGVQFFAALTPLGNQLLNSLTPVSQTLSSIASAVQYVDVFNKSNAGKAGGKSSGGGIGSDLSALVKYSTLPGQEALGSVKYATAPARAAFSGLEQIPSLFQNGPTPKSGSLDSQALQQATAGVTPKYLDEVGQSSLRMAADMQDAATNTLAANNQVAALTKTLPNANTAVQGLLGGLTAYAASAGTAADKSKLLGAVLVASQGDALSYAGAVSQGYAATQSLITTFQQQAADTQSTAGSVNSGAAASALDKVTAATSRLNAAQIKAGNPQKTAADAASAAAAVASAQAALTSANNTLDKASAPTGGKSASLAFADTEKAAIDLNTGLINLKATGAAPLVQQLQAMQTAAENAAEATYQHEVQTKGDSQALQDAQDIFESMTGGALVQNAKQLGLTGDQAKRLADQYFSFDGKTVTTEVQSIGLNDVNTTLQNIGLQLSYLTNKPFPITLTLDAATFGKTLHDVVNEIPGAHAAGGMISGPGTGTSDSILARLSNGEYVSTAASASRNAAALAAGNNGATLVAHYADGGPVGAMSASPSGVGGVLHATVMIGDRVVDVITTAVTEKQNYNRTRRG